MNEIKNKFKFKNIYSLIICLIFIIAIGLRIYVCALNPSLWFDEVALAMNVIDKTVLGCFGPLLLTQAAPPLFLILTKIFVKIFGLHDFSFRIVSFLASIASVFLFYAVVKEYFEKNWTRVVALFIWATSVQLLTYTKEFKPYSLDVFFVLLLLIFFLKYNPEKYTYKKNMFLGTALAVVPWFSFGALFVMASYLFISLLKYFKSNLKKFLLFALPQLISIFVYGIFLHRFYTNSGMNNCWESFFVETNSSIHSFLSLIALNFRIYYTQTTIPLLLVILIVVSSFLIFRKAKDKCAFLVLPVLLIMVLHLFKIYPFFGRVILFLYPFLLLLTFKALDLISWQKKILSIVVIVVYIAFFYFAGYFTNYFKYVLYKDQYCTEELRPLLDIVKQNRKPNELICLLSSTEDAFNYYNIYFKFKRGTYFPIANEESPAAEYYEELNMLEKGETYWLILTHDPKKLDRVEVIERWIREHCLLYQKYDKNCNFMYKIKKIK